MSTMMEMTGGGRLRLWEDGGRVCFRCEDELHRDGLYKVWICGDRGEMLLGTMTPESGRLLLCRTVSREELRRCGCWPVRSARCVMAYPFQQRRQGDGWYWEENPRRLVDEETRKLGEWRRMLCRKGEDFSELAWPVKNGESLPLSHLFCLACPQRIRGELCLIWRFDGQGQPCFPQKVSSETSRSR